MNAQIHFHIQQNPSNTEGTDTNFHNDDTPKRSGGEFLYNIHSSLLAALPNLA